MKREISDQKNRLKKLRAFNTDHKQMANMDVFFNFEVQMPETTLTLTR